MGYFHKIGSNFLEPLGFQTFYSMSAPIIVDFFYVFLIYNLLRLVIAHTRKLPWVDLRMSRIEGFLDEQFRSGGAFVVELFLTGVLVTVFALGNILLDSSDRFFATFLPVSLFVLLIYVVYKICVTLELDMSNYYVILFIGLFILSFSYGTRLANYDIQNKDNVYAFIMRDGYCAEKRLLRSGASGLLLVTPGLQNIEFRSWDEIRTFSDGSCVGF